MLYLSTINLTLVENRNFLIICEPCVCIFIISSSSKYDFLLMKNLVWITAKYLEERLFLLQ